MTQTMPHAAPPAVTDGLPAAHHVTFHAAVGSAFLALGKTAGSLAGPGYWTASITITNPRRRSPGGTSRSASPTRTPPWSATTDRSSSRPFSARNNSPAPSSPRCPRGCAIRQPSQARHQATSSPRPPRQPLARSSRPESPPQGSQASAATCSTCCSAPTSADSPLTWPARSTTGSPAATPPSHGPAARAKARRPTTAFRRPAC